MYREENSERLQRTLRKALSGTGRKITNRKAFVTCKKYRTSVNKVKRQFDSKSEQFGREEIDRIVKKKDQKALTVLKENEIAIATEHYISEVFKRAPIVHRMYRISRYYANYQRFFGHPNLNDFSMLKLISKNKEDLADVYYKNKYGQVKEKKKIKKGDQIFTNSIKGTIEVEEDNFCLDDKISLSNFSAQREESIGHIVDTINSLTESPMKKRKARKILRESNKSERFSTPKVKQKSNRVKTELSVRVKERTSSVRGEKPLRSTLSNFRAFKQNSKKLTFRTKSNASASQIDKVKRIVKQNLAKGRNQTLGNFQARTINININNNIILTEKQKFTPTKVKKSRNKIVKMGNSVEPGKLPLTSPNKFRTAVTGKKLSSLKKKIKLKFSQIF